ncbi:hypothetical protein FIBSPDRAFT_894541 [Athelia psychrophila]|uniref:Uncharacterized protein n=1 Tax=Athelia psychrophila TaxID=1759441 RepID=A0A166FTH9_9AGAM|nr:hypothetical protein FIBSPDRAFT_894541 [Fibularhizoctonia sp. CBS 109695]
MVINSFAICVVLTLHASVWSNLRGVYIHEQYGHNCVRDYGTRSYVEVSPSTTGADTDAIAVLLSLGSTEPPNGSPGETLALVGTSALGGVPEAAGTVAPAAAALLYRATVKAERRGSAPWVTAVTKPGAVSYPCAYSTYTRSHGLESKTSYAKAESSDTTSLYNESHSYGWKRR